jgi:hypothetical protein
MALQERGERREERGRHTLGPDVVVLEHDHAAEIIPMGIDSTDEHSVLLHDPEACLVRGSATAAAPSTRQTHRRTWSRLARPSDDPLPSELPRLDQHTARPDKHCVSAPPLQV